MVLLSSCMIFMIYNYPFILIQLKSFQGKGIKVAFIGKDQTDENIRSNVIAGEYSSVYIRTYMYI